MRSRRLLFGSITFALALLSVYGTREVPLSEAKDAPLAGVIGPDVDDALSRKQESLRAEFRAESPGRKAKPMSNELLQRKYRGILVLHGSLRDRRIALTFDDGPDRKYTPQVLNVLRKHHVKATFFLLGSRAAAYPDVTRAIDKEGHAIGSHSYWHPAMYRVPMDRVRWEVTETDKVLRQLVGYRPKLFRAPYGGLNDSIVKELGKMQKHIIGWNVDSLDWKSLSAKQVIDNVLGGTRPGAIILMHSGGHWTQNLSGMVIALDVIIPALKKKGLKFVTVPELLNIPVKLP